MIKRLIAKSIVPVIFFLISNVIITLFFLMCFVWCNIWDNRLAETWIKLGQTTGLLLPGSIAYLAITFGCIYEGNLKKIKSDAKGENIDE